MTEKVVVAPKVKQQSAHVGPGTFHPEQEGGATQSGFAEERVE